MKTLCSENSTSEDQYKLCIHGLGHTFLLERIGEIFPALKDCDKLDSVRERQLCYSGVFMENRSNIMGGGWIYRKEDDLIYPCNAEDLDEKYKFSCYLQLVLPFTEAFEICNEDTPQEWTHACAAGAGLAAAAVAPYNVDSIIQYCSSGDDLKSSCLYGAYIYISSADNTELLKKYCSKAVEKESFVCPSID